MTKNPIPLNKTPVTCEQPWCTWMILLVLSVAMAITGFVQLPKTFSVPFLVIVMNIMAWLIASRFMHLKEEKKILAFTLVSITIFVVVFLFVLTAWDAVSILHLSTH